MVQIFRIQEKVDSTARHIAIEFNVLFPERDSFMLQKIVRALLSEYGVDSSFGIDENGKEILVFKYETSIPYVILYTAPFDGSQSVIKLIHPRLNGVKDFKDMFMNKGNVI